MKLEQITEGSTVTGLTASNAVTIVAVTPVGDDAVSVVYTDDHGRLGEQLLFRQDEVRLSLQEEGRTWKFDGDGEAFRLTAEALRIKAQPPSPPKTSPHCEAS